MNWPWRDSRFLIVDMVNKTVILVMYLIDKNCVLEKFCAWFQMLSNSECPKETNAQISDAWFDTENATVAANAVHPERIVISVSKDIAK